MIVPIKILATLFLVSLIIGLFLAICYNWNEETKKNKRLERALEVSGVVIVGLIALIVLTYGLQIIWF